MPQGYNGSILHVNLSKGSWEVEKPSEIWYRTYLGGSAMALYYLLKELKPGIDPLSEKNILIFASNVSSGAPLSGFSRYTVAALSPLTNAFGEAEAGGYWGPELKFAGYDGIVFTGRAEKPVYLWIRDGNVEIRDASALWGLDNKETRTRILRELDDPKIRIASIGQAGECQVRFANVINELRHSNGRTGMGAVMGSKRLKAIAVRGTNPMTFADPERVTEISKWLNERIRTDNSTRMLHEFGTAAVLNVNNGLGILPTRNFREGIFEGADKIGGEALLTMLKGRGTCYACAVRCKREVACSEPYEVDPDLGGPEYETLGAFGSLCGVDNLPAIAYAHELCNRFGLDTISAGGAIAFAMECFEEGILTEKDTEGRSLRFGDTDSMLWLIKEIAYRRGLGNILAEGVRKAAQKIGHGTEKFACHVKGQEIPMHDGRGRAGMALSYALSPTGADHNEACPDSRYQAPGPFLDLLAPLGILEPIDARDLGAGKVRAFSILQQAWGLYNSLGVCIFAAVPFFSGGLPFLRLVEAVRAITGWETSLWELMRVGERANVMARMFNIREGIGAGEDRLFPRMHEPIAAGPFKGGFVDPRVLGDAIRLYYEMNGWDGEGKPSRGKLIDLGLDWLVA
jgi:aldehyde:ferredoxin oxidoreductase